MLIKTSLYKSFAINGKPTSFSIQASSQVRRVFESSVLADESSGNDYSFKPRTVEAAVQQFQPGTLEAGMQQSLETREPESKLNDYSFQPRK